MTTLKLSLLAIILLVSAQLTTAQTSSERNIKIGKTIIKLTSVNRSPAIEK